MMKILLRLSVRLFLKPILNPRVPVRWQRRLLAPVGPTQPHVRGSSFEPIQMNAVPGRQIASLASTEGAVLYLHGGAYVTGSPSSHRGMMSYIADRAGVTVYAPDYRMAPEHPYPAALDDSLAAYRWLLDQGYAAENIVIGGDSAGGGLALCTAIAIRDLGLPIPRCLLLLSPWTDLRMISDSVKQNAKIDPMLNPAWGRWAGKLYAGELAVDNPAVSPLFADLAKLPPVLIQVASDEILLDDSRQLADKLRSSGVAVELQLFEGLWHVFQLHTKLLRESLQAIDAQASFIQQHG